MRTTKDALLRYRQLCEQIRLIEPGNIIETPEQKEKRKASLLANYDRFVTYYFPDDARCPSAPFHISLANKIKATSAIRAAFEAYRGSAKSTHTTIFIPIWLMLLGEMKYMLLAGQNEEKACQLISQLQAHLENNRRLIADYGEMKSLGDWTDGKFITQQGITFHAIGLGQSPRGARERGNRPDLIICDDLDTREMCKNPKRVADAVEWVQNDLMGCFDIGNERFIICNNRINKNSILTNMIAVMSKNRNFYHVQVNAVDKNGNPTWPAKYTREYWEDKRSGMGYRAFEREYMNNPVEEGTVFQAKDIRFIKSLPWHQYRDLVCYCDPSFKGTTKNDYKAIMLVGVTDSTEIHVLDLFVRQTSISEMVRWFYELNDRKPPAASIAYYMEANFMQDMLLDEFYLYGKDTAGYQLGIRPDKRKKPDKFQRIEGLSPLFERAVIFFSGHLKGRRDMETMEEQLLAFEKGSRTADDGPDALEGAISLLKASMRTRGIPTRTGKYYNNRARGF